MLWVDELAKSVRRLNAQGGRWDRGNGRHRQRIHTVRAFNLSRDDAHAAVGKFNAVAVAGIQPWNLFLARTFVSCRVSPVEWQLDFYEFDRSPEDAMDFIDVELRPAYESADFEAVLGGQTATPIGP